MSTKNKPNSNKSALIIGCGYVGSKLLYNLDKTGWYVKGIKRQKSNDSRILSVDVRSQYEIKEKFSTVFYMVSAGRFDSESYLNAYVTGVSNTINALRSSKQTPRFIFVSSTSLFSENNGGIVDELSPIDQKSFSKKHLSDGENLVTESGLSSCIVRFSGIYGPGRFRLLENIKNQTAKQKSSPCISNRIHLDDCVGMLTHLANLENPKPLYIASDCEPTPYNDILQWLSHQLKVPEPPLETEPSTSIHMSNKKCSNSLLLSSGYHFKYPTFREGFRSCY